MTSAESRAIHLSLLLVALVPQWRWCNAAEQSKVTADPRRASLVFCCEEGNDLFRAVEAGGRGGPRYASPEDAVENAKPGSAVLMLADGYPEIRTRTDGRVFAAAAEKDL